jgi:hypothetical protein
MRVQRSGHEPDLRGSLQGAIHHDVPRVRRGVVHRVAERTGSRWYCARYLQNTLPHFFGRRRASVRNLTDGVPIADYSELSPELVPMSN